MRRLPVLLAATILAATLPEPAAAQFGRNKVQYRAFDFEILRTDHFDVYFYPEESGAAVDAARMAERAYARLSRVLQHEFRERKPILLYASHAHFQQTNALPGLIDEATGGVTEVMKNRVILPFTGSYADFDHVLTHELVHAFQFDILFRGAGPVVAAGEGVGRLPLWFMEGMAEYLAIGRIDAHTASWVRDAVIHGYLRSVAEMNRRDDYLSYRFGQSLWAYIGERWGDEVVGSLLRKAARSGLEDAFVSTLGVGLDELNRDWLAAVRSRYLPDLARHDGPDVVAHRLTHRDRLDDPWFLAPALSPDGRYLVFASQRDGFFMDLWLADGRTGEVKAKLVTGSRSSGFESLRYQSSAGTFSPDGRYVAFAAQTGGRDALYLYDVERRRVARRLQFDLDGITTPSWSPDGQRLVFTGLDGGASDLFITDLRGRLTRLTDDVHADLQPAWSPDGRTIAFATDRGPGTDLGSLRYGDFRIALLTPTTGEIRILPYQEAGKNINPVWSPDGRTLAWVSDRTGINNLYLFDLDTDALRQVTDLRTGIIGTNHLTPVLTWAAATDRIVFVHFGQAGYDLFALDAPRDLAAVQVVDRRGVGAAAEAEVAATPGDPRLVEGVAPGAAPPPALPEVGLPGGDGFTASFYRSGDTLRPSASLPAERSARRGPISVRELLDSAELALPDADAFELLDYHPRLTPDIIARPSIGVQAGGYYGNGVYGGSFITLSDMLGNHQAAVAANVNGSLADAQFYGGYGFFKHRLNVSTALQQWPLYRYRGLQSFVLEEGDSHSAVLANVFLRDVIRSADLAVAYPFSTFRRLELAITASHYVRDNLYRGYFVDTQRPFQRTDRVGAVFFARPSLALVYDNALFGWTGPLAGRRWRLQLSRTAGQIGFTEVMADVRNYWSWNRWLVLATRAVALVRTGPDSDRFPLYWGGPYFLRGYDGQSYRVGSAECGSGEADSPSLCPARDQLIGASGAVLNTELRFPVITELRLGPLGQFPPVDGVVFFDGGMAWDERVCATFDFDPTRTCAGGERSVRVVWRRGPDQDPYFWRQPLFSWGMGLRLNIWYAVLRLDYAFPLDRDRAGLFSVAFGPSF